MILRAYLAGNEWSTLYGRSFEENLDSEYPPLPSHIRACGSLFHSRDSTSVEQVYTMETEDGLWAYMFFESFAVILLASKDENKTVLSSRMLSLGKAIIKSMGDVINFWNGDLTSLGDIDALVARYVELDLTRPNEDVIEVIEGLVNWVMENPEVAYAGVLDVSGRMIRGNLPEAYIPQVERVVLEGGVGVAMDIVPTRIHVKDHILQVFRINTLAVVVAAQSDSSNMTAIKLASEMAYTLNEALSN
ncbi:MAG: hypothetical protein JSW61_13760 [Candidatus Thorarchaeota archaeon]|nr:MAG: hypothetical protein JSW61_13760 [Candidatus Thorarchaeota archaeon]